MLIVGQKIIFNRIWRINAKSHPFTHAFLGVRFKVVGRALAWHARGHRFDPGNLHQKEKHCTGMCSAFLLCLPSYAAAKFMLDICGKLWYNSFCNCGYSTSASISAFQAEEVGSIPIARSMQTKRAQVIWTWAFLFVLFMQKRGRAFVSARPPDFYALRRRRNTERLLLRPRWRRRAVHRPAS